MKLYALEADHGRCKVGITDQPMERLKTLESSGGFKITNLVFFELGKKAEIYEKAIHNQLGRHRLSTSFGKKSEWFDIGFNFIVVEIIRLVYDLSIWIEDAGIEVTIHERDADAVPACLLIPKTTVLQATEAMKACQSTDNLYGEYEKLCYAFESIFSTRRN